MLFCILHVREAQCKRLHLNAVYHKHVMTLTINLLSGCLFFISAMSVPSTTDLSDVTESVSPACQQKITICHHRLIAHRLILKWNGQIQFLTCTVSSSTWSVRRESCSWFSALATPNISRKLCGSPLSQLLCTLRTSLVNCGWESFCSDCFFWHGALQLDCCMVEVWLSLWVSGNPAELNSCKRIKIQ